jgi:hypothetical protein
VLGLTWAASYGNGPLRVFSSAGFRGLDYSIGPTTLATILHIVGGPFFGGITQAFAPSSRMPFVFFGALDFFGVPFVAYFGKKLNYSRTEYRFLPIASNSKKASSRSTRKSSSSATLRRLRYAKGFCSGFTISAPSIWLR